MKGNIPSYISKQIYNSKYLEHIIPKKGSWVNLKLSTRALWEPILIRDGNEVTISENNNVFINGLSMSK